MCPGLSPQPGCSCATRQVEWQDYREVELFLRVALSSVQEGDHQQGEASSVKRC